MLHEGHPGIVKDLARNYVWWVGMNENIETIVMNAYQLNVSRDNASPIPPWQHPKDPWYTHRLCGSIYV